jgi:hypothetical protein
VSIVPDDLPPLERTPITEQKWQDMVREMTAGDPGIEQSLKRLWDEQGDVIAAPFGSQYDPRPVFGYITTALQALKAQSANPRHG